MKKIKRVPIHVDLNLNQLLFTHSFFEMMIRKKDNTIEYYIDSEDTMFRLLERQGYQFEESEITLDDFIDCGGKMGYNFSKRNIDVKEDCLNIQYNDLLNLLKGYKEDVAIHIHIQYKGELSLPTKRKLDLLEKQNKIHFNQTLSEYLNSNDLYEVYIRANSLNLILSLQHHLSLVSNHLSTLNEIVHCYSIKDIELNLLPEQVNQENTPNANIIQIFEENNSTSVIKQLDSIVLGKDKDHQDVGIYLNDFLLDVGVFGASGSGKGNLLFKMLEQFHNKIPFFVIAPKGELPALSSKYKDIAVYDPMKYFPLNIFEIPKHMVLQDYSPNLKEVLKILLDLDESPSAQSFVSDAIKKTYFIHGYKMNSKWDEGNPFSLRDFALVLEEYIKKSKYAKNEKNNFLQIMNNRISNCIDMHTVFDDVHCIDLENLLNRNTIIDLKSTPNNMINIIMKVLLILLINQIKSKETSKKLRIIVMIDEAHHLFGKNDDYFDCTFGDNLFELRSFGCGFIISDQKMSRLKSSVLDNLTQTINGRLVRGDEEYFFETSHYELKKQQMMSTLPTGTYALKVKGTTLHYIPSLIHPVMIESENVIDEYIHNFDQSKILFKLQAEPFSHCKVCKSKETCLHFNDLREVSRGMNYKYNLSILSTEDKVKCIVKEIKEEYQRNEGYKLIDIKDACNCVYNLMKWEEKRGG